MYDTDSRVVLEPLELGHAPAVQQLASDPEVTATSNLPDPYPDDGAVEWIRQALRLGRGGREFNFVVLADSRLVGCCAVLGVGGQPRRGQLAYWIGRPFWGTGLATAAARLAAGFAFHQGGLERLDSCCLASNLASRRVLEKVGFRFWREGPHPLARNAWSKWTPEQVFAFYQLRPPLP